MHDWNIFVTKLFYRQFSLNFKTPEQPAFILEIWTFCHTECANSQHLERSLQPRTIFVMPLPWSYSFFA